MIKELLNGIVRILENPKKTLTCFLHKVPNNSTCPPLCYQPYTFHCSEAMLHTALSAKR